MHDSKFEEDFQSFAKDLKNHINEKVQKKQKIRNKSSDYIFAIIINIILIFVVNNISRWNFSFISESFSAIVWVLNISFLSTLLINALLLIYQKNWFESLMQFILNIISCITSVVILVIFPFDFSSIGNGWVQPILKLCILIGIIVTAVIAIVQFIKFLILTLSYKNR